MAQVRSWASSHKGLAAALIAVGVIVCLAAAIGVAQATDRPAFCGAACHEMGPYHAAWAQGPHASISCVECHVDSGTVERVTHKAVAMKEVWVHIAGDPKFPNPNTSPVPNERCVRCHEKVKVAGLDHAKHAKDRQCVDCHANAGHTVDPAALAQVDALSVTATHTAEPTGTAVAVVDQGSANVEGHPAVSCTRCHDLAKTGCKACHTPKHDGGGSAKKTAECTTCHAPGTQFVFVHPSDAPDCESCHEPPAENHDFTGECTDCHKQVGVAWTFTHNGQAGCENCHDAPAKHRPGACATCHKSSSKWTFKHPGSSAQCTDCHTRPAGHRAGACASCHRTGVSWAFRHPSGSSCTSCHNRPSGHRSGSCTTCHRTGRSWAFSHPSSGSRCTGCHKRPSGHRSGSCASCHRTGRSWAFRHAGSSRCSSCHRAPSGHYGSSCSACHSPSRKWSNARFSHPRIRGGEHSYRSFACKKCHPSGYGSATCRACHSSSSGPRDD